MMLMKKTMIVGQTASLSSSKTLRKRVTVKTKRARASRKKVLEKVMKLLLLMMMMECQWTHQKQ